jgi:hypothetical protein
MGLRARRRRRLGQNESQDDIEGGTPRTRHEETLWSLRIVQVLQLLRVCVDHRPAPLSLPSPVDFLPPYVSIHEMILLNVKD